MLESDAVAIVEVYVGERNSRKQRHGAGRQYSRDGTLVYEGEWKEDHWHGKGKLWYANGNLRYEGNFEDKDFSGYGVAYHPDGSVAYAGRWEFQMQHGRGIAFGEREGERYYTGEYSWGARHGVGTLHWIVTEEGVRIHCLYEGGWKDDKQHGTGRETRGPHLFDPSCVPPDCEVYEGEWSCGTRHGRGTYRRGETVHYEGEFADGKFHGQGVLRARNVTYQGAFQAGVYEGEGSLYRGDGTLCYEGSWRRGVMHGAGVMYAPNGKDVEYRGGFADGYFHGVGTLWDRRGRRHAGVFERGRRHRERTCAWNAVERARKKRARDEERARRKRDVIVEMHRTCAAVGAVPECVVCGDALHHGDASYVYVPCGHRILCGTCGAAPQGRWKDACMLCKTDPASLVRVFS